VNGHTALPEWDLLKAIELGNRDAFAVLYDRHASLLFGIGCTLLRDVSDAEDLVHDVFLGLPRALKTFEGRGPFEGWLKRTATRTALMKLRQARTRRAALRRLALAAQRTVPPPAVEDRVDIEAALLRLRPGQRDVFILRIVQGFNTRETADLLGVRIGTVRIRLLRARRALRTMLME